jgi:Alpha/beta hydrolase of unknown function (DUF900)
MRYLVDFRAAPTGGAVTGGLLKVEPKGLEGDQAEKSLMNEESVVFLLHGFNVDRPSGTKGLKNLAEFVDPGRGAVVAVLWPGDHGLGPLSYFFEGKDADDTAANLARFIDRAVRKNVPLSFVSHSLGARVVMETIKRLDGDARNIGQICLMAPAIDDFSLASQNNYREQVETAARVAVLSSKEDEVLKYVYPAGDLVQAFLFWDDLAGLALGYHGPVAHPGGGGVPEKVEPVAIPEARNSNHGDYIPSFKSGKKPEGKHQKNQRSAARFAAKIIRGDDKPAYE